MSSAAPPHALTPRGWPSPASPGPAPPAARPAAAQRTESPPLASLDRLVTVAELGFLLGLSERAARDQVTRGNLGPLVDGKLPMAANLRAYCARLREGQGRTTTAERERLVREQADAQAMKNAQARGELVDALAVTRQWAGVLAMVRARILAAPGRLRAKLAHLTPHDEAEIDRELRDALTELAEDEL